MPQKQINKRLRLTTSKILRTEAKFRIKKIIRCLRRSMSIMCEGKAARISEKLEAILIRYRTRRWTIALINSEN